MYGRCGGGVRREFGNLTPMSRFRRRIAIGAIAALLLAGCAQDEETSSGTGEDLPVERRIGYAVVVEEQPERVTIGFSNDRDATSGEAYDVTEALWRIGPDGAWSQPPATCLAKGQRLELGITEVQDEARPGLLFEYVVWLSCLDPEQEEG